MSAISGATSASFNQDQFLQLLVAQLQNQDPSSPVESKEFIAQLATFSQLQGIQSLNATFSESLKLQQLTQGTSLIGKTVDYNLPGGGASLTGKVDSVSVLDGKYSLVIGTAKIGLDQVTNIR